MGRAMRIGKCWLCGEQKPLTREHVPPQKAFNDSQVLMRKLDAHSRDGRFVPAGRPHQGGYSAFTLCADCNNDTGGWYGRAYVEFTEACANRARPEYAAQVVSIPGKFFPMRVAKQALTIICSSCGDGLTDHQPSLRQLLLDKTRRGLHNPLRLYAYLLCNSGGRSSGVCTELRTDTGKHYTVAEFSWWPLGLVLSFTEEPLEQAQDVTDWLDWQYDEPKCGALMLPCLWACTPWPLDHRSPDQVLTETADNLRYMRTKGSNL